MKRPERGWVLYDDECPLCLDIVDRFGALLRSRGFEPEPLQSERIKAKLGKSGDLLREMRVLRTSGEVYGGADAFIELAGYYWWARPAQVLPFIPGMMPVLRKLYAAFAKRRTCFSGACAVHDGTRWAFGWILLVWHLA